MCKIAVVLGLSVTTALSAAAWGQATPTTLASPADAVPMYRVSLEHREAVPGVSASSAIQLPFECTADGWPTQARFWLEWGCSLPQWTVTRTLHRVQEFLEEKRVLYLRLRDPMFLSF